MQEKDKALGALKDKLADLPASEQSQREARLARVALTAQLSRARLKPKEELKKEEAVFARLEPVRDFAALEAKKTSR